MKLNDRSCVLDAFAYIMGYEPAYLAGMVGHKGPEGYHTQELIEVADWDEWSVTSIERFPQYENPETGEISYVDFNEISFIVSGGAESRFISHLRRSDGVILGLGGTRPHAVAWSDGEVYDPSTDTRFPLLNDEGIIELNFRPQIFLRMDQRV